MDNEVKIQFNNEIKNMKDLETYRSTLIQINAVINGLNKDKQNNLTELAKDTNQLMKDTNGETAKMAKQVDVAFNFTTVRAFTRGLKRLTQTIGGYINKSTAFYENLNLLRVAFDGDTTEADKFVNKLSEMYGLDESWGYRTVGLFKQLANSMGIANDMGTKMSKTLTQLSIDVSSLYNIDTDRAVSVLTSALAGQTKPARSIGGDITQPTLQTTLDKAGIDRSITQLSYAEKRLVIITTLLNQLKNATDDWGKTLNSPANQTRILSEQWERLTRALGNIFLPIVYKILPYVNGILMALTEIAKIIGDIMAKIFGFKPEDLDFGSGVGQDLDIFGEKADNATAKTEKLKKSVMGLRSFDKIINISTPKNNGSGAGVGATGISSNILNMANKAMDSYNSKLKNVKLKATEIRDNIMEWLGFTKKIDLNTGKVYWKFDHITSGTVLGALVVGGAIYKGISIIIGLVKKFTTAKDGIKGFNAWSISITSIIAGFGLLKKGMNDITSDANKGFNEMGIGISGLMLGFTLLGNKITALGAYGGPIGMLVGAFVGLFIAVKDGFDSINKAYDSTIHSNKKYVDALKDIKTQTDESIAKDVLRLENGKKYIEILSEITNENGKVKKGYETRATIALEKINELYGTEYKLAGRQIKQNGKVIKSWEDEGKSIDKIIEKKKIEAVINKYQDKVLDIQLKRKEAQDELNRRQDTYNTMLKKWQENEKEAAKYYGVSRKALKASLDRQSQGIENLKETIKDYDTEIKNYDDLVRAHAEGNIEKMEDSVAKYGVETEGYLKRTEKKSGEFVNNIRTLFSNFNAKFKVTADTSSAEDKIKSLLQNFNSNAGNLFKKLFGFGIKGYSNGLLNGLPKVGQLFVANESGPELIGSIGGQSFVANQQQLGNFIERKNQQTKTGSGNQVFNIYLDKNKKLATYTLNELQSMAKSNGSPIEIS